MKSGSIKALWELLRLLNSLITGLTVVVGGILVVDGDLFLLQLSLIGLSATCVAGGGNAINDAYDAEIDKLNRPLRPIPSGRIRNDQAFIWGFSWMMVGIALGFSQSLPLGITATLVSLLLWGYSAWWKRQPLIGNVVVALCGGLAFIYGAVAVHNPVMGIVPALFAFLIHLGREIVKDVEDEHGDRECNARTLPIVLGSEIALRIASLILLLLVTITIVPYQIGWYGSNYFIIVMVGVNLPLIAIAVLLFRSVSQKILGRISSTLKIIMLIGLVALYVG